MQRRAPSCAGLALVALCGCACSDPAAEDPAAPLPGVRAWFREVAQPAGLDFRHESGAAGQLYLPEIMGGGVGLFDADGDGDLDALFVNQNRLLPSTERSGADRNQLWLQREDGRFENATERSGLGHGGFGMGVTVGDMDNDADLDVLLTHYGPAALFRNRGDGSFEDVTREAGIAIDGWSSSAVFFDYDRDGFLDLYVARYLAWDPSKRCSSSAGEPGYCGPSAFPPARGVLLHNRGNGSFEDVSAPSGIATVAAAGLGVVSDDFDEDGWADLYVANDGYANNLWLNRHDGTFADEAVILGAAYNIRGVAEAGMGVLAADFDNDGLQDLFATHLEQETNTLWRNLGSGRGFNDVTETSGAAAGSWLRTGFGTAAFDAELDGDLDLYVANGRVTFAGQREPGCALPEPWCLLGEPGLFHLNDGTGRFAPAGGEAGDLVSRVEVGRGVAAGDVDGDGDVDLLLGSIHGQARLYRNDAPRGGRPLAVRAFDPGLRRDAIGARVTLITDRSRQVRTIHHGGSYLSCGPAVAYFGLPDGETVERIEVRWPDASVETFSAAAEPALLLVRGQGRT